MKKTFEEFKRDFFEIVSSNGQEVMSGYEMTEIPNFKQITSMIFKEFIVEFPRYSEIDQSKIIEIGKYITSLGGMPCFPRYILDVENNTLKVSYHEIYYFSTGIIIFIRKIKGELTFSAISVEAEVAKVLEIYNNIIENYSFEYDENLISNYYKQIARLNKALQTMEEPIRNKRLKKQDEFILKYYKFHEEIQRKIDTIKEPGAFFFYGEPGTGKSTYVKLLAQLNPGIDFIKISLDDFIKYGEHIKTWVKLRYEKDHQRPDIIYFIDDSGLSVRSMNKMGIVDPSQSALLSLIGETDWDFSERIKFIISSNMSISGVEKGFKRPGRMLQAVEFKRFEGEELEQIAQDLKVELSDLERKTGLTIDELYHHSRITSKEGEKKRKIGFI